MAEAFLKKYGSEFFEVESAGLDPGCLNPLVVEVMQELGIDLSKNKTNSAFEFLKQGKSYSYLITVCDETSGERCPIFPGVMERTHWNFTDPSMLEGTKQEKLTKLRLIRDSIKERILEFIEHTTKDKVKQSTG